LCSRTIWAYSPRDGILVYVAEKFSLSLVPWPAYLFLFPFHVAQREPVGVVEDLLLFSFQIFFDGAYAREKLEKTAS
jgi:hypothetical protein